MAKHLARARLLADGVEKIGLAKQIAEQATGNCLRLGCSKRLGGATAKEFRGADPLGARDDGLRLTFGAGLDRGSVRPLQDCGLGRRPYPPLHLQVG